MTETNNAVVAPALPELTVGPRGKLHHRDARCLVAEVRESTPENRLILILTVEQDAKHPFTAVLVRMDPRAVVAYLEDRIQRSTSRRAVAVSASVEVKGREPRNGSAEGWDQIVTDGVFRWLRVRYADLAVSQLVYRARLNGTSNALSKALIAGRLNSETLRKGGCID